MDSKDNLQFKALVKKKAMLFIKLGAHRKQAVFTSSIYNIIFKENKTNLLPIKTMERRVGVVLVSLLLTLNMLHTLF